MTLRGLTKNALNRVLRHANARIESLTVEKADQARLRAVEATGHFDGPVFPVPESFSQMDYTALLREVKRHSTRIDELARPADDSASYTLDNGYFTSPDAEVLYAMIHLYRPSRIIEVGSGNSTKLMRAATIDAGLRTEISSIDPEPRTDLKHATDRVFRQPVEFLDPQLIVTPLERNDILFIDSSHTMRPCGDVVFLFLQVLPLLRPGVIVHVHDFFAPYDYPKEWIVDLRWPWNEQYLVQALLTFGNCFDVLWAGHFIQRTRPDFCTHFPHANGRMASSLWLQKASDVDLPIALLGEVRPAPKRES